MAKKVLKFGGTSVGTIERIVHVAKIIKKEYEKENDFKYDLVVNTTPGETASILVDHIDSPSSTFFEVLYNPWPTQLLSHWREAGGFGIDGLDLLIHQAISQVEIFASCEVDRDPIAKMLRNVGEKALS